MRTFVPQPVMTKYQITGADVRPGTVFYTFLSLRGLIRLAFCAKRRYQGASARVTPQAGLAPSTKRVRVPADFCFERIRWLHTLEGLLAPLGMTQCQARFTAIAWIRHAGRGPAADRELERVRDNLLNLRELVVANSTITPQSGRHVPTPKRVRVPSDFDSERQVWLMSLENAFAFLDMGEMATRLTSIAIIRSVSWDAIGAAEVNRVVGNLIRTRDFVSNFETPKEGDPIVIEPQGGLLSIPVMHSLDMDQVKSLPETLIKGAWDSVTKVAKDMYDDFGNNKNVVLNLGSVCLLAYGELTGKIPGPVCIMLALMAYATRLPQVPAHLYDALLSIFWAHSRVTKQDGVAAPVAMVALMASLFPGCQRGSAETLAQMFKENLSKLKGAKRFAEDLEFSFDSFLTVLQELVNFCHETIGTPALQFKGDPYWMVTEFEKDVSKAIADAMADPCPEMSGLLGTLEGRGMSLKNEFLRLSTSRAQAEKVNVILHELHLAKAKLKRLNSGITDIRPEPVVAIFTGAPGIGKSIATQVLTQELLAATLPLNRLDALLKNPSSFIYSRDQAENYWSGYANQEVCYVDEFGAIKDVPGGGPTIWSDFIRIVNTVPMPLNQAAIEGKGVSYFTSKYVIGTTNRMHFDDIYSIVEKKAVHRRLRVYVAYVKKEYATDETVHGRIEHRKPDWSRLRSKIGGKVSFDHLEFFLMEDCATGVHSTTPLSYEQVRDELISMRHQRENEFIGLRASGEERVRSIVTERLRQYRQETVEAPPAPPQTYPALADVAASQIGKLRNMFSSERADSAVLSEPLGVQIVAQSGMPPKGKTPVYARARSSSDTVVAPSYVPGSYPTSPSIRVSDSEEDIELYTASIDQAEAAYRRRCVGGSSKEPLRPSVALVDDSDGSNRRVHVQRLPSGENVDFTDLTPEELEEIFKSTNEYIEAYEKRRARWSLIKRSAAALAAAVAVAGTIYLGIKVAFPATNIAEQAQAYAQRKARKHIHRPSKIVPQIGTDKNAQDSILAMGTHNLYSIHIKRSDGRYQFQGTALAVDRGCILVPYHFTAVWAELAGRADEESDLDIDRDARVIFTGCAPRVNKTTNQEARVRHDYSVVDAADFMVVSVTPNEEDDLAMVVVPDLFARRIINKFRPKAEMPASGACALVGLVANDKLTITQSRCGRFVKEANAMKYSETGEVVGHEVFSYDIKTNAGDCGSILTALDKKPGLIIGVHVAGVSKGFTSSRGAAVLVDKEHVEAAVHTVHSALGFIKVLDPLEREEVKKVVVSPEGGITRQGVNAIARVKPPVLASATTIIPSPIHGMTGVAPRTAPALLRKKGDIDPMDNAIWGYGLGGTYIKSNIFEACVGNYLQMLATNSHAPDPSTRRVFSNKEALDGLDGHEFCGAIPRDTSPGYPFTIASSKIKKLAFGGEDEAGRRPASYDNDCAKRVFAAADEIIEAAKRGEVSPGIFMDFLKDERRKLDRVAAGKTRLISGSGIDHVIAVRRYFLPFTEWFMENRIANESGVGVNPYSDDWDAMAERLGGGSPAFRVICGDFSGFDKTLTPQLMRVIARAADIFYCDYGSEAHRVRQALVEGVCHSVHVDGGDLYVWAGSNPSGWVLTTPANTAANCVLIRCALVTALLKKGVQYSVALETVFNRDLVRTMAYGDDNVIALKHHPILDLITGPDLEAAMAELGFKYTDAAKTGTAQALTLHEASFLKRGFKQTHHYVPRKWMSPLDTTTIEESIQWTRKSDDPLYVHWRANVETMMLEASAHGREYYEDYCHRVAQAAISCDEPSVIPVLGFRAAQSKLLSSTAHY